MAIQQLPDAAFRSVSDYAAAMDDIHARYDPVFGPAAVSVMERLSVFNVFRSVWFSASLLLLTLSIIICTLDRTPRLWRGVAEVRVTQPDSYYDQRLPDRAAMTGLAAADVGTAFRRRGFTVREEVAADGGAIHVYGDRNQYTKMATLFTHLGLILFLVAAVVTSVAGDEQGLVVAEGESLTVQPIGTPGLLLVKNLAFDAPGFESGFATDFTTDLAVYQDGTEIARKTIRVNDPLAIAGYTFHQNGFGAAPRLVVRDGEGQPLWDAAVPLTDSAAGRPYGILAVPGRDLGLQLLLERADDGTGILIVLPYRVVGTDADGMPIPENYPPVQLQRGDTRVSDELDLSIQLTDFSEYTLLIAKNDPGIGFVWLASVALLTGIVITFYLPRRRVWARVQASGDTAVVWRSDRYVDVEREFGRLLDDLVAVRNHAARQEPADGR